MNKFFAAFSFVLLLTLGACGGLHVAYKQGAGADSLAAAEAKCRGQGNYEQCMSAQGWTLHSGKGGDPDNPLMTASPIDNQSGAPPSSTLPRFVAAAPAPKDAKVPSSPPDPLTKFNVSSWWKMGGGPDELKTSTAACVDKLGPAHRPEPDSPLMTRGLILCLKEKGWNGLQGY